MTIRFFRLSSLLAAVIICSAQLYSQNKFQFIQRSDNDILTYMDTVSEKRPAPKVFNEALSKFLNDRKKQVRKEEVIPFSYMQTFCIRTPESNSIFAVEIDENSFGMYIFLFFFDEQNQTCSEPAAINASFMKNDEEGFKEWNGRMLERPIVSFEDVDGCGESELIFNRRAHNGTWNAVETIVYKLAGSKIDKWFSFNSKELKNIGTETMIKRKIKSLSNGIVTLAVTAYDTTFQITGEMPDETIAIGKH